MKFSTTTQLILGYFLLVNLGAYLLCGFDKWRAVKNQWRIPEKTLLLSAALGGSPGFLLGMFTFRHKIRKPKFYIGVPLILALQLLLLWLLERR